MKLKGEKQNQWKEKFLKTSVKLISSKTDREKIEMSQIDNIRNERIYITTDHGSDTVL